MAHDVFISYSADDKPIADAMCSTLESNGLRCWMAPRDILPGMDWGGSIIDAIATTRVMVLVLSSNSNTSPHVTREVERAVNKNAIVIPFRIEDISLSKSLEYQLSSTHWMDAVTPPLEDHLQTLAARIEQILALEKPVDATVPRKERVPVKPVTPFYRKREVVYLSGGLVLGLIGLVSLVLWLNRTKPVLQVNVPQSTSTQTPTPTPGSQPTISQDRAAASPTQNSNIQGPNANSGTTPSSSGELAIPQIYGKAYDVARRLLIRAGWQPHEKHISHGRDPEVQLGNGPIFWKRGYRELEQCSGSALAECLFEFIDPTERVLVVVTQGEEDENGTYHATVKRTVIKSK